MYYIMAFLKSDILSTNKVDIEKFFFCLGFLLSIDYCLGNSFQKNKETLHYFYTDFKDAKI